MTDVTLDQAFKAAGEVSEALMALQLYAADLDDDQVSRDVAKLVGCRAALTRVGDTLARMRIDERVLAGTAFLDNNDRRSEPTLDGTTPNARQE